MKLPSGPATPAPDASAALTEATAACRAVSTLTAEIAVSGSVGGRAASRAAAGRPGRARVGASRGGRAVRTAAVHLRRPRRRRHAAAAARWSRARTRAARGRARGGRRRAARCGGAAGRAHRLRQRAGRCRRARQLGDDWRVVPDGAREVYLHREARRGAWRIVAVVNREADATTWRAEYRDFSVAGAIAGLPQTVRLASVGSNRFDLRLALSQVDDQRDAGAPPCSRVQIPAGAVPITLAELKDVRPAGPLTERCASLTVPAFAKINLTLRVLGVRDDGYHALRTVLQSLALHDTLTFRAARGAVPHRVRRSRRARPTGPTSSGARPTWCGGPRAVAGRPARRRRSDREADPARRPGWAAAAATRRRPFAAWWRSGGSISRASGCTPSPPASAPTCRSFSRAARRSASTGAIWSFRCIDQPAAWVTLVLPPFGVSTKDAYGWFDRGRPSTSPSAGRSETASTRVRQAADERSTRGVVRAAEWGNDLEPPVAASSSGDRAR